MTQPTAKPAAATPKPSAIKFYRDTLDDTLIRVAADGVPDVLWEDGTWHAYPDANLQTEAVELTPDGAATLASGADLAAPREAAAPAGIPKPSPKPAAASPRA